MSLSSLKYSKMPLDRVALLRNDSDWVKSQFDRPEALIMPMWKNKSLLKLDEGLSLYPEIIYHSKSYSDLLLSSLLEPILLGIKNSTPIFVIDLSHLSEKVALNIFSEGEFIDLREVGSLLNAEDAALLGYARAMVHWHYNNQYCGTCGSKTTSRLGGNMRTCADDSCVKETFPRTDPAVIMLVEKKGENGEPNKCLMGSSGRFAKNAYSTLAGFVEPGETLEEAVVREVYEEAGIHVKNVQYVASQPWPFPASIMLGFTAEAVSFDINCDDDELIDARWFTASEILDAGEWGDENDQFKLPRKDSIARFLINSWMEKMQVTSQ